MTYKKGIICLVSGGMDSLVATALGIADLKQDRAFGSPVYFLHINYGQKTESKELSCFHQLADFFQIPSAHRRIIDLSFLSQIGGSSLTDDQIAVKNFDGDSSHIPSSYVPFRNTLMLSFAVSWAEVIGAKKIYIGAVYEDASGYPDCRPSYYRAFNQLIKEGTREGTTEGSAEGQIEVITPLINLSKEEIIKKAVELQAPLHLTWSCYAREDKACGVCDSCALRLRGFQKAGLEDPIPYMIKPEYK